MNQNHKKHQSLLDQIHDTYKKKNADYGNSFEEQMDEYGELAGIIRLDDKLRRLKQLLNNKAQVTTESKRDTLLDLANYAIMEVMWIDKREEQEKIPGHPVKWEPVDIYEKPITMKISEEIVCAHKLIRMSTSDPLAPKYKCVHCGLIITDVLV